MAERVEQRLGQVAAELDVSETVRAAGGVIWRRADLGIEIVLVHRPAYDDWTFPKGKLLDGETEVAAALREVEEETGLRCRLGRDLGTIAYRDGKGRPKTVRYWEMNDVGGSFAAANEVDEMRWVPIDEVATMLTYEHDRALMTLLVVPG